MSFSVSLALRQQPIWATSAYPYFQPSLGNSVNEFSLMPQLETYELQLKDFEASCDYVLLNSFYLSPFVA